MQIILINLECLQILVTINQIKLSEVIGFYCFKLFFQTSLEYSSLLAGLGPSMPDVEEEEVDSGRSFLPVTTSAPAAPVTTSSHSEVAVVAPSDDDEFLPTADRNQLLLDELDDEEENSSLCKLLLELLQIKLAKIHLFNIIAS